MEALQELLQYLKVEARLDLKAVAVLHVLGLTGTADGRDMLLQVLQLPQLLTDLTEDSNASVAKDSCLCLVNLSADVKNVPRLLEVGADNPRRSIVTLMAFNVCDPESTLADPACMILSNLTRPRASCERVLDILEKSTVLSHLVKMVSLKDTNKKGANLNYLGPVLSNLSQLPVMRRYLLDEENYYIENLFPFNNFESSVRRGGMVGTLRNCCFDTDSHMLLLGEDLDILPQLLLPLTGPEEFPEDDMEKLPPDLQYMPEDKTREPDPDIRRMLLEAITQLCITRAGREVIREKNTYLILRELHKWEKDRPALLACENLVDILIRTEDEIGKDNLLSVEVPPDMTEKFQKMDEDFISDQ